jgi:hypothetical protein
MAETIAGDLQRDARSPEQGGVRVSQAMESHGGEARSPEQAAERVRQPMGWY